MLGLCYAWYRGSTHVCAIVLVTAGLTAKAQWPKLRKSCVTRSIDGCLAVVRRTIQECRPDLVIGSSWGGGLTCLLIARGEIQGPVLLLAPALKRMCIASGNERYNFDAIRLAVHRNVAATEGQEVRIVHGNRDGIVPLQDSRELADGQSQIQLDVVEKGDHGMKSYLLDKGSLRAWINTQQTQ